MPPVPGSTPARGQVTRCGPALRPRLLRPGSPSASSPKRRATRARRCFAVTSARVPCSVRTPPVRLGCRKEAAGGRAGHGKACSWATGCIGRRRISLGKLEAMRPGGPNAPLLVMAWSLNELLGAERDEPTCSQWRGLKRYRPSAERRNQRHRLVHRVLARDCKRLQGRAVIRKRCQATGRVDAPSTKAHLSLTGVTVLAVSCHLSKGQVLPIIHWWRPSCRRSQQNALEPSRGTGIVDTT